MKTSDFFFELPPDRIAQFPTERRGDSLLMVLDRKSGGIAHYTVAELPQLLERGTLLVFNDSRVRNARVFAKDAASGEAVEFLFLERAEDNEENTKTVWKTLTKKRNRRQAGTRLVMPDGRIAEIAGWEDIHCLLAFEEPIDESWLERYGHVPLPPYIKRQNRAADARRYQTVYARETGSAAAPTAGLHFTEELFLEFERHEIETAFITLHTGLGTFLPVYAENPKDHKMHREWYTINDGAAKQIEQAKREGRPVIAVGTTSLRALESAWQENALKRGTAATSLFIYGDYHFKTADMLFTNFHTPASSLIMLVSSFCGKYADAETGRKILLNAYNEAITSQYRFFSYGDAMLIR